MAKDTRDLGSYESNPKLNEKIKKYLKRENAANRAKLASRSGIPPEELGFVDRGQRTNSKEQDAVSYIKRLKRRAYLEETCDEEAIRELINPDKDYNFLNSPTAERLKEEFGLLRKAGAKLPLIDYEVTPTEIIAQKYINFIKNLRALPV